MGGFSSGLRDKIYFLIMKFYNQQFQSKKKKMQYNSEQNVISYGVETLFLM